jgi:platelet-activating factor acetylhydrolase
VVVFSHGLGGSRNAYSFLLGSLASYGIVVIAPDHRDGSAPISYIRATEKTPAKTIPYRKYSHTPSQEVYDARDEQLRTRLWELGLIHDAIVKIDDGNCPRNLDPNSSYRWRKNVNEVLDMFVGRLSVQQPGSIIWAGHSFGAATTVQFVKSTFYQIDPEKAALENYTPLFTPSKSSTLFKQITPNSPCILLDMWCLSFRSEATRWLWEKPMPCFASSGPGGSALLTVLSEGFSKWSGNLNDTKRTLAPPPTLRDENQSKPNARMFYSATAAHLSQSDFGILFPFMIKRFLKVDDPERILRLNVRAILQAMRDNGYQVADTSKADMEEVLGDGEQSRPMCASKAQDWRILDTNGAVQGWHAISPGVESDEASIESQSKAPQDEMDETEVLGEVRI